MSDHQPKHRSLQKCEKRQWELREGIRSRIGELRALLETKKQRAEQDADPTVRAAAPTLYKSAAVELCIAEEALNHCDCPRRLASAHLAAAQTHLDAALNLLLRLAPLDDVTARIPNLLALVREHLAETDPRRVRVEQIAKNALKPKAEAKPLSYEEREALIDAAGVARQALQREHLRVLSFVRVVLFVTLGLMVMAVAVAVLGSLFPQLVPLCFRQPRPELDSFDIVCPTRSELVPKTATEGYAQAGSSWDYLVVELVGLVAASVAAAATLRRIKGTSTPYNVPVALALLKLPTGALTAVLGLLLMRGEFVPGLSALDSSAQIIAWAIVFGYAQQIFTRLVDDQGQAVLNAVGGPNNIPPVRDRDTQEQT
ncbi:hypothetical protein GCM10020367_66310 [Streptomyces sannanensis]|uniref:Uncharacterized protein n=1 Tax=Streptomyces sannanensis TaxID=285536 RepID=A0ABP6S3U8_9ACTN